MRFNTGKKDKCQWCGKTYDTSFKLLSSYCSKKCEAEAKQNHQSNKRKGHGAADDLLQRLQRQKENNRKIRMARIEYSKCKYCGEDGILGFAQDDVIDFKSQLYLKILPLEIDGEIISMNRYTSDDKETKLLKKIADPDNKGVCLDCFPKYNLDVDKKNSKILGVSIDELRKKEEKAVKLGISIYELLEEEKERLKKEEGERLKKEEKEKLKREEEEKLKKEEKEKLKREEEEKLKREEEERLKREEEERLKREEEERLKREAKKRGISIDELRKKENAVMGMWGCLLFVAVIVFFYFLFAWWFGFHLF